MNPQATTPSGRAVAYAGVNILLQRASGEGGGQGTMHIHCRTIRPGQVCTRLFVFANQDGGRGLGG